MSKLVKFVIEKWPKIYWHSIMTRKPMKVFYRDLKRAFQVALTVFQGSRK